MISRPHDNEDIAQRLKSLAIEVETIRDKRKKETDAMNHALSKVRQYFVFLISITNVHTYKQADILLDRCY